MGEDLTLEAEADTHTVEAAIMFAMAKHAGQKDKSGKPYILHPLRVMLSLYPNEKAMMVAVLHDVIEDCGVTASELLAVDFPEDVVAAVQLVSRPGKDAPNRPTYRQYVQAIIDSKNMLAITVKIADTYDNLGRVDELPQDQRGIRTRYNETIRMFAEAGY